MSGKCIVCCCFFRNMRFSSANGSSSWSRQSQTKNTNVNRMISLFGVMLYMGGQCCFEKSTYFKIQSNINYKLMCWSKKMYMQLGYLISRCLKHGIVSERRSSWQYCHVGIISLMLCSEDDVRCFGGSWNFMGPSWGGFMRGWVAGWVAGWVGGCRLLVTTP